MCIRDSSSMASTSEIILSNQTHPGDSTVSIVSGSKFKGDGYYSRSDGFHTVQYSVTGFIGTIDTQASLADNPVEADWFNITASQMLSANDSSTYNTGSFIYNFTGNYVWVRIKVSNWTDGTVNSVLLNH